ncbi:HPr kinase/phosphatase C-terminal domain-containing protein [uncultured Jannaschia sp.]|uniref:HPr kinase/phosphorylase n=1 Tax=uncultured Jannaschia sp. TaxID=293347 RepID=UPI002635FC95|nr:HPr kinase/phosphatase C-terminal domain-containing protein [uncultured Jannaschia sp.]
MESGGAIDGDTAWRLHRTRPDRGTIHGTAIAFRGRGLLILGPAGSGKTGLAAELMIMGAGLVSDDLVVLTSNGSVLIAARPEGAASAMELRGLGILTVSQARPTPITAVLHLVTSPTRLPDEATVTLLDHIMPLLRLPSRHDTAAKVALWLTAA